MEIIDRKKNNKKIFISKKKNKHKILLYQENDFHTEVAGFLIYHFKDKFTIDIYHPHIHSSNNCFNYYEKIFNIKLNYISDIIESQYIHIFVLTYNEITNLNVNRSSKYTLIKHKNDNNDLGYNYISLTPVVKSLFHILPIYQYDNNNTRYNVISIIGNISHKNVRNFGEIIILANILKRFNIYIFTRKISSKLERLLPSNCKIFINEPTEPMINKIRKCRYIFTADTEYYSDENNGILTGMIPLALNNNVPLILSKELNSIYQFEGVIVNSDINETANRINKMTLDDYNKLLKVFINHKNKILNTNKNKLNRLIK